MSTYTQETAAELAEDWYNATPKKEIIEFMESRGKSIVSPSGDLFDDWGCRAIDEKRIELLS
jgi:basic membrane lipoprotein Med (substrate-binding protein (PBP1-ABC) superfamily)